MQIGSNPAQFGNRNHHRFRASLPTRRVGDGDLYPCETRGGAGRCCEQENKTEKSGKYEITHVGNGSKGDYSASGTRFPDLGRLLFLPFTVLPSHPSSFHNQRMAVDIVSGAGAEKYCGSPTIPPLSPSPVGMCS